jgi:hypothetical protein
MFLRKVLINLIITDIDFPESLIRFLKSLENQFIYPNPPTGGV